MHRPPASRRFVAALLSLLLLGSASPVLVAAACGTVAPCAMPCCHHRLSAERPTGERPCDGALLDGGSRHQVAASRCAQQPSDAVVAPVMATSEHCSHCQAPLTGLAARRPVHHQHVAAAPDTRAERSVTHLPDLDRLIQYGSLII